MLHRYPTIVIALIGFRQKEINRIKKQTETDSVQFIDGGCIEDGSNMQKRAVAAAQRCRIVFWRPKYAKHLPSQFVSTHDVRHVNGVSMAVAEARDII